MAKKRSNSITGIDEMNKFLKNNDMKNNRKHRKSLPANFIPRNQQQDNESGWVIEKITNYKFFPSQNTIKFLGKWYSEGREDYNYKQSYLNYHQIKGNSILKQWAINNSHINKYKTNWIVKFNYFDRFPNCTMVCMYQDCTTQNIPTTQLCELHKCRFINCHNEHNKTSEWCDKHWRQKQNQNQKRTKTKQQQKNKKQYQSQYQSQNSSPLIKTRAQKKAINKAQTQPQSPKNSVNGSVSPKINLASVDPNVIDQDQYYPTDYSQSISQFSFVFPPILPPSPIRHNNQRLYSKSLSQHILYHQ